MLDETDLRLAHLLQIDPRISWARAGEILQISPTTAANHWRRLVGSGLAWITTYPNPDNRFTAVVEVDCRNEHLPAVIHRLCQHPLVVSVDEATGRRDLLLTVMAPDMTSLTNLIIDWIGKLEGVYGTRSSLVTTTIVGPESWMLGVLTKRQIHQATPQLLPDRAPAQLGAADRALADALAVNGRASIASLSQILDVPSSTVHRRLTRLLANRNVIMRCDVAPELAGWLLECTWMITVPLSHFAPPGAKAGRHGPPRRNYSQVRSLQSQDRTCRAVESPDLSSAGVRHLSTPRGTATTGPCRAWVPTRPRDDH